MHHVKSNQKRSVAADGIWSRSGLLEIMHGIPLEYLQRPGMPSVYAACCAVLPGYGATYFNWAFPPQAAVGLSGVIIPLLGLTPWNFLNAAAKKTGDS